MHQYAVSQIISVTYVGNKLQVFDNVVLWQPLCIFSADYTYDLLVMLMLSRLHFVLCRAFNCCTFRSTFKLLLVKFIAVLLICEITVMTTSQNFRYMYSVLLYCIDAFCDACLSACRTFTDFTACLLLLLDSCL